MDNVNQLTKNLSRAVKLRIMQAVIVYPRTENLLKDIDRAKKSKVYLEVEDLSTADGQKEAVRFIADNPEMKRLSSTDLNLSMLNMILSEDESGYKLMDCIIFQRTSVPTLCIRNKRGSANKDGVSILVDLSDAKRRLDEHYHYYDPYYSLAFNTAVIVGATIGVNYSKVWLDWISSKK